MVRGNALVWEKKKAKFLDLGKKHQDPEIFASPRPEISGLLLDKFRLTLTNVDKPTMTSRELDRLVQRNAKLFSPDPEIIPKKI